MALDAFLKKFVVSEKGSPCNYTKIGDRELGVFGNKYFIPDDKVDEFYKVYRKHVFEEKKEAYLTEKQHDIGKVVIDLDFRYAPEIEKKQHSKDHIIDFVELMVNAFCDTFTTIEGNKLEFYVFEKDHVNLCDDITKDGIHIITNVECDFATKMIIRDYVVDNIGDIWDDVLPIKNEWKDVVDESVMKGHANWQLYGSQKPGKEMYKLKYIIEMNVDESGEIAFQEVDVKKINFDKYFPMFCARTKHSLLNFRLDENKKEVYERYQNQVSSKKKKTHAKLKRRNRATCNSYEDIKNEDDLNHMVDELFNDSMTDYTLKEVHNYTMCLTKEYWGPGSYDKWIRVGWALRNTHEDLFITWYKLSSQSEDFDYESNDLYEYWTNFDIYNKEGLTSKSIIYWAKMCNFEEYEKIYKKTVDYYVYYSFHNNTEFDLANTLYHMYKSHFVCASIKDKLWYEFSNNKWIMTDSGVSLRMKISVEMYKHYSNKVFEFQMNAQAQQNNIAIDAPASASNNELSDAENHVIAGFTDTSSDSFSDYKKKMNDMLATTKLLKKTTTKANIMKEASELFYDKDFLNKLDKNPYLLGCNNCVIDFKEKNHRKGKHDDYMHKSTNLTYKPIEYYEKNSPDIIAEINSFFEQLFPNESLRGYMWEHLASTLMGTNENQTFNIYTGSGANGKSKLVELMSLVLGEYKGTVPISLVTQKRTNIGSTSSEIYSLIGTRYAVMQEPSKGDKINEGIMKELTGGDPIQCRALFKDSVTFIPQFKLVVCTNTLFDIVSNDDGTWRRLRKVDFESKFTHNPYNDPKFPVEDYPYQFQIDTKIDEKFKVWAPVFLSMLVKVAYRTQGNVKDVAVVLEATDSYRQEQDVYLEFNNLFIDQKPSPSGKGIKFRDIMDRFKDWFTKTYNNRTMPNGKDVQKYFDHRYGKYNNKTGWTNISFKFEIEDAEHFT